MTPNLREAVTDLLLNAGCGDSNECEAIADAILALPALSVPEGWVAVPREVVEPFVEAVESADDDRVGDHTSAWESPVAVSLTYGDFRRLHKAMLSAIPSPGGEGSSRPRPIDGAGNLGSAVASGDDGDAAAPEHAPDCQSHIVDVRGRPDPCTCGLEPEGGAA